jgi:hypothetical protein
VALFIAYTTLLPFLNQSRSTPLKPSFFLCSPLLLLSSFVFSLQKKSSRKPTINLKEEKKKTPEGEGRNARVDTFLVGRGCGCSWFDDFCLGSLAMFLFQRP